MALYDEHVLYPIDFNHVAPAFEVRRVPANLSLDAVGPPRDAFGGLDPRHFAPRVRTVVTPESLLRSSLSVHLYGSITKHMSPAPGSLVDVVMRGLALRLVAPFVRAALSGPSASAAAGLRAPAVHVVTPASRRDGMPPADRIVAWAAAPAGALSLRLRAAGVADVVSSHAGLRSLNAALAKYTGAADALAGAAQRSLDVELSVEGVVEAAAAVRLVDFEASVTLCVLLSGGCRCAYGDMDSRMRAPVRLMRIRIRPRAAQ